MTDSDQHQRRPPDGEKIEPIAFRSSSRGRKRKSRYPVKIWLLASIGTLAAVLLLTAVWFVFTARQVSITITPVPDDISIQGGFPTLKLGEHHMLRPGSYMLTAEKTCFNPLSESFVVGKARVQHLSFDLKQSPGKLSIHVHEKNDPAIQSIQARIVIDGQAVATAPITRMDIEPGRRHLEVLAGQYQPFIREIEIEGCSKEQQLQVSLVPDRAEVQISSIPPGDVSVNNQATGRTPLKIKLPAGIHDLRIEAKGHQPWQKQLTVKAGEPVDLKDIRLRPADGHVTITSTPPGAAVMIGDRFAGQTPLTVNLTPDREHILYFSKTGFAKTKRKVMLASNEKKKMRIRLTAQMGVIAFDLHPKGAELILNNRNMGPVPERLNLPALPQKIELRLKGYKVYKTTVTPRPGLTQQIKTNLEPLNTTVTAHRSRYKAGNGYPLVLVQPGIFTMGSSRREQGRRSNETLRRIKLTRPFLMGLREVTNKEFRLFKRDHNSGVYKDHSLNRDDQPVVRVTWREAALFCNWLSAKDGLPEVYGRKGDTLVAARPLSRGYRLPTEAEWEFCARFDGMRAEARYPWGKTFPPQKKKGNFGDLSAKNLFSRYIEGYNDNYVVTAPPARFEANTLGLFDMGGNVAEWCHDVYTIYSSDPGEVYADPVGPEKGDLWVIKGSGWKDSSISELRAAYRGYGNDKRDDVGFRVCRYAQ